MKIKIFLYTIILLTLNLSCSDSKVKEKVAEVSTIGSGDDKITVVVVSGTPYEMGYQLGSALKEEVKAAMTNFLKFAKMGEPERYNNKNLDNAWKSVSPYIKDRFKEELKGLSEGSGVPLIELKRAHMVPVIGNYACSGVDVWGKATTNGHLYQIRNLDFTMRGELQNYPTIVIYKPDKGIAHASPAFAGYIAAHTGINAKGIVLSEKGASPGKEYPFNLDGTHFSTLFRDILYDANNLNEAVDMIKSTKLIKRYHLYVGDGKPETMGAVKILVSSPDSVKLTIWKDNDPTDEVAPKVKENVCYYTMKNEKAYNFLSENYGKFDHEKMIELSKLVADDDGNLEDVVYDATSLEMWIAYAKDLEIAGSRPYIHIDLKKYLK